MKPDTPIRSSSTLSRQGTRSVLAFLVLLLAVGAFVPSVAHAAITFVGEENDGCATDDPGSVNVPAGTQDGDVMILMKSYMESAVFGQLPNDAGWTLLGSQLDQNGGGDDLSVKARLYYRVADSEPGSYSTDWIAAQGHCAAILVFRGARGAISDAIWDSQGGTTASAVTLSVPEIDLPSDLGAVVYIAASAEPRTYSNWAATTPSSLTEILEVSNAGTPDASIGAAWATVSSGSASGAGTVDQSSASVAGGFLVSLVDNDASIPHQVVFTASGTWTVPANVAAVDVEAWGGGGGGGPSPIGATHGTGGGGGGAYSASTGLAVTPAEDITVSVGTGGSNGADGNDSYFRNTSTVMAKGGAGVPSDTLAGGLGGSAASGAGATKFSGGAGGDGDATDAGGGGGSAGSMENGGDGGDAAGVGGAGGAAGSVGGASGGIGGGALVADSPGGGGGGAPPQQAGRTGGAGKVIVRFFLDEGGGGARVMRLLGNVRFRGVRLLGL